VRLTHGLLDELLCVGPVGWEKMHRMVTDDELAGLNTVLNEADLGPIWVDLADRRAQIQFRCLMLDADGNEPEDRVLTLCMTGVSRIVGSLRDGNWDDESAEVLPLALADLSDTILRFDGQVYGWSFFDPPEDEWAHWRDRLSFDERLSNVDAPHVVDLFQEGGSLGHLDFRVWFEDAWIQRHDVRPALHDVIASADRWWDAMYAGDPATVGHGIVRAGPMSPPKRRLWPWSRKDS